MSIVTPIRECPRRLEITFGCVPRSIRIEAWLWRRSWNRTSGVEETRDDNHALVDNFFAEEDLSSPIRSVVHGENGTFTTTRLDNGESITEKYGLNWVVDFTNLTITYRGLWSNLTGNTSTFKDVGQLQGMLDFVVGFGTIDFSAGQHDQFEAEGGPFYFDNPAIDAICTALS